MRLATLRDGTRDGRLAVVRADGARLASAAEVAPTLQAALDRWEELAPRLRALSRDLDEGRLEGAPVEPARLSAPLPRAYEWIDGSAYLNHVRLARRARGAEPPPSLETDPLVYQGGSGVLLGPTDPLRLLDPAFGLDLEGELCAVLGDVPLGASPEAALPLVRLLCLANDVTYRNLVPGELAKGFGFFQSKPATAFAPFAATPDELGAAWRDGRAHLRVRALVDGALLGDCEAGPEMHFSFADLAAHAARTRALTAGTLLGSGTVSNADPSRGALCLAERRMREILESGAARTPFLARGQRVVIEALDAAGRSVFGRVEQEVV
ncbi:fumarylacetoacetate hydrolase family protein [Anaeromyxobacter paludicola]|uniref:Fumarylacetoacetate hydrolase n=1 Tax=Anaeromyxobacter paludicola TaxID=2918171 RepID=A0ABN6NAK0_9BACT|nr:fumarylacetoacetate hydrolase family protein [Anaeromyxobacter paludicola]BDG10234.1 fumarylacetoacetate hydrolase [Anaeromyxobacter paludicola]